MQRLDCHAAAACHGLDRTGTLQTSTVQPLLRLHIAVLSLYGLLDPSKPSQYARFQRRVLSWAAVAVLRAIILIGVSGLLSTTTYLSDLGDSAVVGIFVAVIGALYPAQTQFVKETG